MATLPHLSRYPSRDECREWLQTMTRLLGGGFNPDTPGADYVTETGERTFSDDDAVQCDQNVNTAFLYFGEAVYEICMEVVQEMFPEIGADYR